MSPVKRPRLATSSAPCVLFHGLALAVPPQAATKESNGMGRDMPADRDIGRGNGGRISSPKLCCAYDQNCHKAVLAKDNSIPGLEQSLEEGEQRSTFFGQSPAHGTAGAGFADVVQSHGGKEAQHTGDHDDRGFASSKAMNNMTDGVQVKTDCKHQPIKSPEPLWEYGNARTGITLHCGGELNLLLTSMQSPTLKGRILGPLVEEVSPVPVSHSQRDLDELPEATAADPFPDPQCGGTARTAQSLPESAPCRCDCKVASLSIEPTLVCTSMSVFVTLPPTQVEEAACKSPFLAPECSGLPQDTITKSAKCQDHRSLEFLLPATSGAQRFCKLSIASDFCLVLCISASQLSPCPDLCLAYQAFVRCQAQSISGNDCSCGPHTAVPNHC